MSEAVVVNLFLFVRILLVGGLLIVLPRITRKGLLFGVYVGEALDEGGAARRLVGRWSRACVVLMVLSLLVGLAISVAGKPVAGNLTGTAVLLLGALGLFVRFHSSARRMAPPAAARQAEIAAAPLDTGPTGGTKGEDLAKLALGLCVVASLAALGYTLAVYDRSLGISLAVALLVPSLNLLFSPFLALMALLTASAKRSVRGGSGGHSMEAQAAFRTAMTRLFSTSALVMCAYWSVLSVQIARSGLSRPSVLALGIGAAVVVVFVAGGLIRIMRKYGQGGALVEEGSAEAPLTNGLADNAHWVLGLFYVDQNDPSILVEKRFGLGYAFNLGNRTAILILAVLCGLGLSLGVLTLVAMMQGP